MLHLSNVSKRYGDVLLFEGVHIDVNAGEWVGLVGPNGCGKTTLLRIIMGLEAPDTGNVRLDPGVQPGYLPQAVEAPPGATVHDFLGGGQQAADRLADRLQALATRMASASPSELAGLEEAYNATLERLTQATDALPEHEVARVLAGLGLEAVLPDTPVEILSGGQRTRVGLARLLISNPSLLLLDEPTNHLDIAALEWLEAYLRGHRGAMLIVSHDRTFLDRTVNGILEIDPVDHVARSYAGSYADYALAKSREREKQWQAYREQQETMARLQGAIGQLKNHAGSIERETIHFHYRKIAKKVARQATVRQRRLERMLEAEDRVEKPGQSWALKLDFADTPPSGQDVLIIEGLGKRFGQRTLFAEVNLTLRRGERVAFIGPNGAGKTTLLRIIVGEETPSEGSVRLGANVQVGYLAQEQEHLEAELSALETVRRHAALSETDARSFLHFFLFAGEEVFLPVGQLSFGERARLSLGILVLQGCNLLLLDEPINHLDIPSRERFEAALAQFEGTVLAVVHDRAFIQRIATGIWALERETIRRYVDLVHAQAAGTGSWPAAS